MHNKNETKDLTVARGHLMPSQQQQYNGLANPTDYSIFYGSGSTLAQEWTCRH